MLLRQLFFFPAVFLTDLCSGRAVAAEDVTGGSVRGPTSANESEDSAAINARNPNERLLDAALSGNRDAIGPLVDVGADVRFVAKVSIFLLLLLFL
jgi:hypothetical protein